MRLGWGTRSPAFVAIALGVLALAALANLLAGPSWQMLARPSAASGYDAGRMLLLYSTLPRLAMALLCGAGLGASGAVLQQVLSNPLASPTTIGIDAGARLALAAATLFAPTLLGLGRDAVALLGSVTSTLLVFALVRRRGFSPLAMVLAGLVVSLYCGALSSMLVLMKDRYLASLFIWGSGSLSQQSWDPAASLAWRLLLVALPLGLLARPLSLLDLGDSSARSLGLSVSRLRVLSVGLALLLSAFVTSAAGVIGFIGLVAPTIARLSGARRFGERLAWSAVMGALLLLVTDASLQLLAGASGEFIPTGAVTAVLGSPLLLLLMPRLERRTPPPQRGAAASAVATLRPRAIAGMALLVGLVALTVLVGRDAHGSWQITPMAQWHDVMVWRLPRICAAACAGALLGTAGLVLQRMTGNAMASPEVLGISAGAIFAVAMSLFIFGPLADVVQSAVATVGGGIVLATILVLVRSSAFAPERVLLVGIALSALIDAVVGVLSSTGDPRALLLLGWMSGSTNGASPSGAVQAAIAMVALVAGSLLASRWLAILPLGAAQAGALGVPLRRARLLLLLLAAALTAAATPIIGPFTFVGLMAPHIVLALGIRRPFTAILTAAAAGGGMMAVADGVARTVAFPVQLPTGLVAAMIGAPFLMLLLNRRSRSP